ncbi:hypothetical protein [Paracoccus cavernae]|uniref:hypothetical protein n=1 Tax=Paracoccus cavernae TaxID=1571207 RepID=UPI0036455476
MAVGGDLKRKLVLIALGLGLALTVWQANRIALRHYLSVDAARAETAMRLTINALEGDLARYEVVPQLLADLDAIRLLAATPTTTNGARRSTP